LERVDGFAVALAVLTQPSNPEKYDNGLGRAGFGFLKPLSREREREWGEGKQRQD
jgi:hypothetical protein